MAKIQRIQLDDLKLWEDENYLALNKPPFLSTLEDRSTPKNLLAMVRTEIPDAQACHRLDKDTSGVIVFAKNPEAYRHLSIQFEKRTVSKTYHAVVDGIHNFQELLVDAPILKQNDGVVKISKPFGKQAQTYFTSITSYRNHTLVACRPITGRMHQIRIHLALSGAPITGDETYGGKPFFLSSVKRDFNLKRNTEEKPIMERMALHAKSLEFDDLNGKRVKIEAPYPKDMEALIRQLTRNA